MPRGFHLLLQICVPPFLTVLCAPGGQPVWTGSKEILTPQRAVDFCQWESPVGDQRVEGRRGRVIAPQNPSLGGCPELAASLNPP